MELLHHIISRQNKLKNELPHWTWIQIICKHPNKKNNVPAHNPQSSVTWLPMKVSLSQESDANWKQLLCPPLVPDLCDVIYSLSNTNEAHWNRKFSDKRYYNPLSFFVSLSLDLRNTVAAVGLPLFLPLIFYCTILCDFHLVIFMHAQKRNDVR